MICYKLDKEIIIDKLVNDIRKLLNKHKNLESYVLIVSIQQIIDCDSQPKNLEYKGDSPT